MRRRIVQVGVAPSGIGLDWLHAIAQAPDWTLAGIVDTQPAHLQSAADRVGLSAERCFSTIGAAAAAVDFDACVLVVPSPLHAALCGQALDARKHVIVEKPFTVDMVDARPRRSGRTGGPVPRRRPKLPLHERDGHAPARYPRPRRRTWTPVMASTAAVSPTRSSGSPRS